MGDVKSCDLCHQVFIPHGQSNTNGRWQWTNVGLGEGKRGRVVVGVFEYTSESDEAHSHSGIALDVCGACVLGLLTRVVEGGD